MKSVRKYRVGKEEREIKYSYIPGRYILAMMITILELLAIITIIVLLCYYVPYFYLAAFFTQIFVVIKIVSSSDNPEYKGPWLLVVISLPIVGFMLYFIFYSRKLSKKYQKRLAKLNGMHIKYEDSDVILQIQGESRVAASHAKMLKSIASTHIYYCDTCKYYSLGEEMHKDLLEDLKRAKKYIFMEYFIIEEGDFWDSIHDILKKKAAAGVEVRVVFDDIGCMSTLPGNYVSILRSCGIQAVSFSRLKGNADGEFNNRNHRKITVIDGKIGYTGGVNIADEYINKVERFGHWKDTSIRITGDSVRELIKLFLTDYYLNVKDATESFDKYFDARSQATIGKGYLIPFGDGPRPIYERRVAKCAIQNLLASAVEYVYITTPYLIIDNELCQSIESAALRGVDVRIIMPHIPDKKLVFEISRSFYPRLASSGVKIYEYTPGFVHAKMYIADGKYAIIGTVNLDYRSLIHHFENGIWMYGTDVIEDIERDFLETQKKCEYVGSGKSVGVCKRIIRKIGRIFAPLL